jgi:glycosidase
VFASCKTESKKITKVTSNVVHPDWSKDAVIYEVNVRQYTPEGTLKAFENHLPRLKEMGVDILWLMPVHPIGEKNRKGSMGSYYSVRDYTAVNPEFGTLDDFKDLVNTAHELGMYVILDWVANHTAWDHAWIEDHPDWYTKDENGEMISPFDWTDVAELDDDNEAMQTAMIDAMKFWITEADIDGYRCDVAAEVPLGFWNRSRAELDELKAVFMLAEAEEVEHHEHAFDMSYAWELHHLMNDVAKGEKNVKDLDAYYKKHDKRFPADAYRMTFITNHDENSWNGTEYERMGEAVNTFAVLTYTLPGMPMLYTGQEAAFDRRLKFFIKDSVDWADYPLSDFYKKLGQLRKENPALWSGSEGGKMRRVETSDNESVYAFLRKKGENIVLVLTNLSDAPKEFILNFKGKEKAMKDWFSGENVQIFSGEPLTLAPWEYQVLVSNK